MSSWNDLLELLPGVNFINIIRTNFLYECRFSSYVLALLKNSYEKRACITLMKLTAGVNFINILRLAFMCADPKSAKKIDNLTVFFVLSGSARVKATQIMLMKLTPN